MRIYLAARYGRLDEIQGYARELAKMGHEVTSRWHRGGGHRASDEDLLNSLTRAREFANDDLNDVLDADVCISFTEPPRSVTSRGGRHVEFGLAYGAGMRCIIVGPRENVFHALEFVEVYPTWEEARRALDTP